MRKAYATGVQSSSPSGERRYTSTMRKVLVVDDDSHIRDIVVFALRRAGFEVEEAANGEAALERIEGDRPD